MSEKFLKAIVYISIALAIIIGIVLTVVGGMINGWNGVGLMLGGQALYVILLYLYNQKYR